MAFSPACFCRRAHLQASRRGRKKRPGARQANSRHLYGPRPDLSFLARRPQSLILDKDLCQTSACRSRTKQSRRRRRDRGRSPRCPNAMHILFRGCWEATTDSTGRSPGKAPCPRSKVSKERLKTWQPCECVPGDIRNKHYLRHILHSISTIITLCGSQQCIGAGGAVPLLWLALLAP